MYEYVHGGDIYAVEDFNEKNFLDFSANINPLGLPETVKEAICSAWKDCENYPDPFCRKLREAIARAENTDPDKVFCGNGASEIIFRLVLAVKPQKALVLAPTFADYERALQTVGCTVDYYPLSSEKGFQIDEDYLSYLEGGGSAPFDIIFICNPNNPTGELCKNSLLKKILNQCQQTHTLVVVDECFMDFIDQQDPYSAQAYLDEFPNLVILKAFTKIYAMPGIRLGYAMTTNSELHDRLRLAGPDWSVSTLAQAAGIAALSQQDYVLHTKEFVKTEREFLIKALREFGFTIYGSKANYIFFRSSGIWDLDKSLLAHQILIRSCANYQGLDVQYYRIAVKKREQNLRLIKGIKEVLS